MESIEAVRDSILKQSVSNLSEESSRRLREHELRHSESVGHDVHNTPENLERIEKAMKALELVQEHHPDTTFKYQVHESGVIQVRMVSNETGETIEEIPSSKLLEFNAGIKELAGLVLEQRA